MFYFSSIEVLRMQKENQQLRKTIDELKNSNQRIIELETANEQLQKATLEGKTTVFHLNEVSRCNSVVHCINTLLISYRNRNNYISKTKTTIQRYYRDNNDDVTSFKMTILWLLCLSFYYRSPKQIKDS